jgi:hypothetical protein
MMPWKSDYIKKEEIVKMKYLVGGPIICYTMDKLSGTIFKDNKPYQER